MNETSSMPDKGREALLSALGKELRALVINMEAARARVAKTEGLHPTDLGCLRLLDRLGKPASAKSINAELGLSSGSGTALLDRLESAGYVRRTPNPLDRRSVMIELNPIAAAGPLSRYRQIEDAYRQATEALAEEELQVIAKFLMEMNATSEAIFKDPVP
ncbi:DNA-binding transcriptional regulator, MarR family [Devosia crocina]|uniref:DNA-binding transcriptional regulator, MarR family n=1 Tax=Devosia crocina TaxID=429728 RepID=A0A1I7NPM0_9HYPH|nr:MarR family transcriptional regulator [Devosia crocina]SFV36572.1 DNA-binding transcriptional regulator, MarR family [Devosia crocina]